MGFENSLDDDDYGIILDREGKLKGIWIPQGNEDEPIPDGIVNFLMEHWGIDPNE